MTRLLAFALSLALAPWAGACAFAPEAPAAAPRYLFQLSRADAESALSQALSEKSEGRKIRANITSHSGDALFSYGSPLTVEVRGLTSDPQTHRWSASLMFVAEGLIVSALPVSGRMEETLEVPVLKRQVRAGEVITEKDIAVHDFALNVVRSDTVTDMAGLIGKSPQRVISQHRPIRAGELARPALVKKGAIVQMRYAASGMEITTAGQAAGEGARGEVIAVRNLASKKLVRAMIDDDASVRVLGASHDLTQNEGGPYAAN